MQTINTTETNTFESSKTDKNTPTQRKFDSTPNGAKRKKHTQQETGSKKCRLSTKFESTSRNLYLKPDIVQVGLGVPGRKRPRQSEDVYLRKQREIDTLKLNLRDCEIALCDREHFLRECSHNLQVWKRALYERDRQISDLISENKSLNRMLSVKDINLKRLGKQEHQARMEKRQSQENLRRERAKLARMEVNANLRNQLLKETDIQIEQLQKINEEYSRKDEDVEEEPVIDNRKPLLTESTLKTFIKEEFTKIASKRRSTSLSFKEFVTVVYYPYSEGAFGKVSDILLLEEITNACEEDEATDQISCSLTTSEISSIITSQWNQDHLDHILKLFTKYKHSSYVLQRLWDMGYHQAKDVVRGLEKNQAELFKPEHALMKSKIFGKDGNKLPDKTCFVSGLHQNGVGDHMYPVRGNRHITGCYGGNYQWNLVSVISALNQPYKTCILFDLNQEIFIKTSLDYTTLVPLTNFPMEALCQTLNEESFKDAYKRIKQEFQDQPFSATIKQKHWYLQEDRTTKEIVHNRCILIRDKEHLLQILNIDEERITFLLSFPKLKRWGDGATKFINDLLVNDLIQTALSQKLDNPTIFLETLCKKGKKTTEEQAFLVNSTSHLIDIDLSKKNKYTLNECQELIFKIMELDEEMNKMNCCNAIPVLNWLKIKQGKGLYVVSDAYDIWLKLQLWEYYVSTVVGSPKMFWEMSPQDFEIIEESLRAGVKSIDRATQEFIKNKY